MLFQLGKKEEKKNKKYTRVKTAQHNGGNSVGNNNIEQQSPHLHCEAEVVPLVH